MFREVENQMSIIIVSSKIYYFKSKIRHDLSVKSFVSIVPQR